VKIIPFGIQCNKFVPAKMAGVMNNQIVIGAVKSMEKIYGIDLLIKAFADVKVRVPEINVQLLLIGGGSMESEYLELSQKLGIGSDVTFISKVPYAEVPQWHQKIDIFVNVSRNESFGVSVLEASSSGKPVIVSRVGGLPEVVRDGITGLIVGPENVNELSDAIIRLLRDESLRRSMGVAGRLFVEESYDFQKNVNDTLKVYDQLLAAKK
jgi:glycosyltransferase involved in cell wall biosynthesis